MDTKPNEIPDPQAEVVPELPLTPEQASDVKGGKLLDAKSPKLSDVACKGTHVPAVTIE